MTNDTTTHTKAVEAAARAICRAAAMTGDDPTCVMDEHPERPPCTPENCPRFEQAQVALAAAKAVEMEDKPSLTAQVAKLTEERNFLRLDLHNANVSAERAESELAALDKSHADLARKLANAATDIRAQTIEECLRVELPIHDRRIENDDNRDFMGGYSQAIADFSDAIRSLSTSQPPPSGEWRPPWQPISTAPMNYDVVLLYQPARPDTVEAVGQGHRTNLSEYAHDKWQFQATGWRAEPTHWMPLPPPPTAEGGER